MKRSTCINIIIFLTITTACAVASDDVILWTFQTSDAIYTDPVNHENTLYFGSLDSTFYAVSTENGEEFWHFKTDNPIQSTAAVFENGICFESGNQLYVLDFQGRLLWQKLLYTESLTNQIDTWDFVHSSPNIIGEIVYIGTEKGWIYGFNIQNGEELMKIQTPGQGTIRVKPAIDNNRIYTGDWDGVLYCHDRETGSLLWQYDTRKDAVYDWTNAIETPLLIADGVIYFAGRSCMAYALNAATGNKLWVYNQSPVWIVGGTVIADGMIYFGSSNQSLLYALDVGNGQSRWNAALDFRLWNTPLVSGDFLFFGSRSFYAMNRFTGKVVSRLFFNPDSVHKKPVHIYYWAADFYGTSDAISNFHSSAIEVDGKIIVGCDDGKLYALDRENFITLPKSETSMENGDMLLGNLNQGMVHQIEVPLTNTGDKNDTVTVTLGGATILKRAVTLDQEQLVIPARSTVPITIQVNTSDLKVKSYTLSVIVDSRWNIQDSHMIRYIKFDVVESTDVITDPDALPYQFALERNMPNPFNPSTRISYTVPKLSDVELSVFDVLGHTVMSLVHEEQAAGRYSVMLDGSNMDSGIYVCVLKSGEQHSVRKIMLVK